MTDIISSSSGFFLFFRNRRRDCGRTFTYLFSMSKPRLIAFYLPQYYPTPENDQWWGKGFTEWTNVGRAKPLFPGHYQPKVPTDLGYYDLRLPQVREEQAKLAAEAGIEGFCYWHYWFGNGKRLLSEVFTEVVQTGKPDFPFCLCWANHSWYAKTWDPKTPDKLLAEQKYLGDEDYKMHFMALLPAFKDRRYMTVNGKLIFGVFAPQRFPDFVRFKQVWNALALEHGLSGFYFYALNRVPEAEKQLYKSGYDSIATDCVDHRLQNQSKASIYFNGILRRLRIPRPTNYKSYCKDFLKNYIPSTTNHPCIYPNFDHAPRSGCRGIILTNSTPKNWYDFLKKVLDVTKNRYDEDNLIFIKAWNEWGEGNYMEPDIKYGSGFITYTKKALNESI